MRFVIIEEIIINAPAREVWHILAHEFDKVEQWSTGILKSEALIDIPIPEGASVGGRACYTDNVFGNSAYEAFTYYDEQAMRFGYKAIRELPRFFKSGENNWGVTAVDKDSCEVAFFAIVETDFLTGLVMMPLFPIIKKIFGSRTLEELKYFVEHGKPHPRGRNA